MTKLLAAAALAVAVAAPALAAPPPPPYSCTIVYKQTPVSDVAVPMIVCYG